MLRRSHLFFCATAAASTPPATSAASSTTATETPATAAATTPKPASNNTSAYTLSAWKEVKVQPWMQRQSNINKKPSSQSSFMFHGDKCGQQPVLLLPSLSFSKNVLASTTTTTTSNNNNTSYSTLFSALNHQHGVLSVPYGDIDPIKIASAANKKKALARKLRGDCTTSSIIQSTQLEIDASSEADDGFMTEYCHDVVRKLDQMGVDWVTCVGESFGAFVAAKLALLFPERVGSIFLLNTPLVSPATMHYNDQLNQARKAVQDVNVPKQMYEFTLFQELLGGGETEEMDKQGAALAKMLPSSNGKDDEDLDTAAVMALFGRTSKDPKEFDGEVLDDKMKSILADADINGWMTHDQLNLLRHPMCMAIPADKSAQEIETSAASTLAAHEKCFNIRRIAKIKSAPAKVKSLMAADGSSSTTTNEKDSGSSKNSNNNSTKIIEETADALSQWVKRYDADELVKKRWQQAKTDMERLIGGNKDDNEKKAAAGEGSSGDDKKEGKGGKKGKKEKNKDKKK